jgi:cytochrome c1
MRRLAILFLVGLVAACGSGDGRAHAQEGKALIAQHCAACHRVPGVALARGRVGPSLAHIRQQQIIAGYFPNSPSLLTRWIEHPQKLLPGNAMPEMHLSHEQAMTIVDYLYTME